MEVSHLFTDQVPPAARVACRVCDNGWLVANHECPRTVAANDRHAAVRERWLESLGSVDLLKILVDLKEENRRLASEVVALRTRVDDLENPAGPFGQ